LLAIRWPVCRSHGHSTHDQKARHQAVPVGRKEVGLTAIERYEASRALHAEKESSGIREHMSYGELLAWLRAWTELWRAP
jgi:hypothetical protein